MIRYFTGHPTAANVLMAVILMLGLVALPQLQRDTFPLTPITEVEIRIAYAGATPAEVEDVLCQRLEDALDSITGLREMRCDARENLAITTVQMVEGGDIDTFYNDAKSQVEAMTGLPEKVEKASIVKLERTATVADIAITGAMAPQGLKAYAETVKERLKRDRRIAQVRVLGFSGQSLLIELSAATLQRFGLTLGDIRSAIERQNISKVTPASCAAARSGVPSPLDHISDGMSATGSRHAAKAVSAATEASTAAT